MPTPLYTPTEISFGLPSLSTEVAGKAIIDLARPASWPSPMLSKTGMHLYRQITAEPTGSEHVVLTPAVYPR